MTAGNRLLRELDQHHKKDLQKIGMSWKEAQKHHADTKKTVVEVCWIRVETQTKNQYHKQWHTWFNDISGWVAENKVAAV